MNNNFDDSVDFDTCEISDFYLEKQVKIKSGVLDLFIKFRINFDHKIALFETKNGLKTIIFRNTRRGGFEFQKKIKNF